MVANDEQNRAPAQEPILRVQNVVKRFGGTLALDDVNFEVRSGEIHALLGQNGAGKSTLIKVLAGIHTIDHGELMFAGQHFKPAADDPRISFIHQELGLINTLTVAENIALVAGFPRRGSLISWRATARQAAEVLRTIGSSLDPEELVATLNAGDRALVAVARALYLKTVELLVLDEPTAQLRQPDVERLFAALTILRDRGVGLLYVTHRLDEVFRMADRVSVLRDGRMVSTSALSQTSPHDLVEMIIGRSANESVDVMPRTRGDIVVSFRDLVVGPVGPVSGGVHEGECVALVGLQGAGQEMVARALVGAVRIQKGEVWLQGARYAPRHPADGISRGLAFISGNRADEGIVLSMVVRENLFLNPPSYPSFRAIGRRRERDQTREVLNRFDVRPLITEATIHTLSGGNQQKVLLARWLTQARKVLVLEEPSTGVDVGAKEAIYQLIRGFLVDGGAVILVSADLGEVVELADRALVFDRGRVVREVPAAELSLQSLTLAVAGGRTAVSTENHTASTAEGDWKE
jgi:ribose transport system ATP-binding protein